MGVYVSITNEKTGQCLIEGKYGVGFPLLMFSRYESRNKNHLVFRATGKEAIENIDKVLEHIKANITKENTKGLTSIKNSLLNVRRQLSPSATYISDYSELLYGIENPDFDYMRFIQEYQDKLEDAIHGYNCHPAKKPEITMFEHFLKSLSSDIHPWVFNSNDKIVVATIRVDLTDDEKLQLKKGSFYEQVTDDETARFSERKLFYILKNSGLKFTICNINSCQFHVIFDADEIELWLARKPYVQCSYRLSSTYDINCYVRNTAEELEKFYVFAKNHDRVVSIIINWYELINESADEVASVIGKHISIDSCNADEIDMKYL